MHPSHCPARFQNAGFDILILRNLGLERDGSDKMLSRTRRTVRMQAWWVWCGWGVSEMERVVRDGVNSVVALISWFTSKLRVQAKLKIVEQFEC